MLPTLKQTDPILKETAEKIATALYLVTGLMSDSEPMKWNLRKKALSLISDTEKGAFLNLSKTGNEVISLITMAGIAGIVSPMNKEILVSQMNAFVGKGMSLMGSKEGEKEIHDVFMISRPALLQKDNLQGHSQGQITSAPKPIKKILLRVRPSVNGPLGKERKEKIMNLVREKGSVMIKDIAHAIQNCSEKTIQRDLGDLVQEGALKRRGERRWTVYFV